MRREYSLFFSASFVRSDFWHFKGCIPLGNSRTKALAFPHGRNEGEWCFDGCSLQYFIFPALQMFLNVKRGMGFCSGQKCRFSRNYTSFKFLEYLFISMLVFTCIAHFPRPWLITTSDWQWPLLCSIFTVVFCAEVFFNLFQLSLWHVGLESQFQLQCQCQFESGHWFQPWSLPTLEPIWFEGMVVRPPPKHPLCTAPGGGAHGFHMASKEVIPNAYHTTYHTSFVSVVIPLLVKTYSSCWSMPNDTR